MEIVTSLFGIAKYALSFLSSKEARRYHDRVMWLEKMYLREENKDEKDRDHNAMDSYTWELQQLCNTITQLKE